MNLVSERRDGGRSFTAASALIALAVVALLAFANRAQAAEVIFWDNWSADPDSVSFAGIDGGGGGALNLGGATLEGPEGMAYDSVSNRLFVASAKGDAGEILAINLDGSGASPLTAPGAVVADPQGVVVDPATRTIYWTNTEGAGSIGWANLDGGGGGQLNTAGATLSGPRRIALDPVAGRVYWANSTPAPNTISYANVNNSGGGNLDLAGAPGPVFISGLAVDPAGGRIYWLDNEGKKIGFASLAGGGGGEVNIAGAPFADPFGLAFDPALGRLYWGNYNGATEVRANAFGFANLAGGVGGITPATAPVDGPQDPVILKSPIGTAPPVVTRGFQSAGGVRVTKGARATLSCSQGIWVADLPGSFVYQAPRSLAYQWERNGEAIGGATAATFIAAAPGSYTCSVTATNQTGSAAQTSARAKVKAAKLKLVVKPKKASAKPGELITFRVRAINQGDLKSRKVRLCPKLAKSARSDLKAPKCKKLGKVKSRTRKTTKLRVRVADSAEGLYRVKIVPRGSTGKAVTAKVKVVG